MPYCPAIDSIEGGEGIRSHLTGTMHRAMPCDPDFGRLIRTKLQGEEPLT